MNRHSRQKPLEIPAPVAKEMTRQIKKAFAFFHNHSAEMKRMRAEHQQAKTQVQEEINRGTRQTSGSIFEHIEN